MIVSGVPPAFPTVKLRVAVCPIATEPKSIVVGLIVICAAGAAEPCSGTSTAAAVGHEPQLGIEGLRERARGRRRREPDADSDRVAGRDRHGSRWWRAGS